MGLAAGGLAGALTYARLGVSGLWIATGVAGALEVVAARMWGPAGVNRTPTPFDGVDQAAMLPVRTNRVCQDRASSSSIGVCRP